MNVAYEALDRGYLPDFVLVRCVLTSSTHLP